MITEPDSGDAPALLRPVRTRPGWIRRLAGAIALVLATGVVYYGVTVVRVIAAAAGDGAATADAIVVLGAAQYDGRPSPELAARLDTVAELWSAGRARVVVVTGGKMPGDRFTEAATSATYLQRRGVPAEAILLEDRGRTTWESLNGAAPLLRSVGARRLIVVSSSYHVLRSRSMLVQLGFEASGTAPDRTHDGAWWQRVAKEAAGVAVGELVGFEHLEPVNP
ncbi:MAG: YdcF family protein [Acidimicrobiales bacterium]